MRSKKAIKNIIFSFGLNIVTIIFGFIVPKLIIVNYGSNTNGLINSITEFLGYIALLEAGIGPVIKSKLYKPIAYKDEKEIKNILYASQKFFNVIVYIFIVYIIGLLLIYPNIVSGNFDKIFTISLLLIISVSTLAEYFFGITYSLFLQAKQENYITSVFRIVTTILNSSVVIALILLKSDILLVKGISAIILVLRPIILNLYVKKKYKLDFKDVDKNYKIKDKWDGLAQHIAAVIHGKTDIVVLTLFTSLAEVSIYSVYLLVINGIKIFAESFTSGIDATFGDMIAKDEHESLNNSFKLYETIYYTILTIVYACTILLIVPFVKVYTTGVTDANYIRPLFAFFIVLGHFMHAIRLPYSTLTYSAGHFKETMKGAWIEAITNVVISVALVLKFGMVGVAIGTLVAMLIRTIEFNYHSSKYILKRNILKNFIKPFVSVIEVLILFFALNYLNIINVTNYFNWILYAVIILGISSVVIALINLCLYKNDFVQIKNLIKNRKKA